MLILRIRESSWCTWIAIRVHKHHSLFLLTNLGDEVLKIKSHHNVIEPPSASHAKKGSLGSVKVCVAASPTVIPTSFLDLPWELRKEIYKLITPIEWGANGEPLDRYNILGRLTCPPSTRRTLRQTSADSVRNGPSLESETAEDLPPSE